MSAPSFLQSSDPRPGLYITPNYAVLQENRIRGSQTPLYQGQESMRQPMQEAIPREIPSPIATSGPYFLNADAMRGDITNSQYPNQHYRDSHAGSSLREVHNMSRSPPKTHTKRNSGNSRVNLPRGQKPATAKRTAGSTIPNTPSSHQDSSEARSANENNKLATKSKASGSGNNTHHKATAPRQDLSGVNVSIRCRDRSSKPSTS